MPAIATEGVEKKKIHQKAKSGVRKPEVRKGIGRFVVTVSSDFWLSDS
jgi:hypothetical protein